MWETSGDCLSLSLSLSHHLSLSLYNRTRRFESSGKIMSLYSTFGVSHTALPYKVGVEAEETPELRAHNTTLCVPCGMS